MAKLRYLRLTFDFSLSQTEVPAFRGAIAARVGPERTLFHQHQNHADGSHSLRREYALIQYKRLYKQATIIALHKAVDEIHYLFADTDWAIDLNGRSCLLKVDKLDLKEYAIRVLPPEEELYTYSLRNWLALNPEKYEEYQQAAGIGKRVQLLESILTGQILNLLEGVGIRLQDRFVVHLQDLPEHYVMTHKGVKHTAFSLRFRTNLFLPNYLGLGKGASRGFGVLKFHPEKKKKTRKERL